MKILLIAATVLALIASPPGAFATKMSTATATAEIVNVAGDVVGKAMFEQTPTGVLIFVKAWNLPPGPHGIHLHAVGSCTPDFNAAAGHINPDKVAHGLRNPDGPDHGDLPNVYVAADGTVQAEFFTTRVSIMGKARRHRPALLDEDGSAVVIHDLPDDHLTQPIGGAGGRIGCGVIKRP